ncbi:MAG TPA: TraR/DksA family transcriptional regulator [Candidatus Sumerlaeota bacterium]|nr:TraR/DksA family transcriptional regulator [Candidatus Sumerlaeota bacterium]HOR29263.1 TraR/DksA family transcriptional regulator [Candidatus Sumerlaeota bacterium]HPK01865.1 TraR/DksA family transcriptional regulator [Candidatus Sumerlaeota bacterium]
MAKKKISKTAGGATSRNSKKAKAPAVRAKSPARKAASKPSAGAERRAAKPAAKKSLAGKGAVRKAAPKKAVKAKPAAGGKSVAKKRPAARPKPAAPKPVKKQSAAKKKVAVKKVTAKKAAPKATPKSRPAAKATRPAVKRPSAAPAAAEKKPADGAQARRDAVRKAAAEQAYTVARKARERAREEKDRLIPDLDRPTGMYNGIILAENPKPFPQRTPYSKKELEKLRDALREERARLISQLESIHRLNMETLDLAKEHPGFSVHMAEHATDLQTAEANLGVRTIEEERLTLVEAALDRLENNVNHYGLCLACGAKIGIQRLIARPHAHLCLDCRQRYEKMRSRRGY